MADRLYLTLIDVAPEGDVLFPEFDCHSWTGRRRGRGRGRRQQPSSARRSSCSNAAVARPAPDAAVTPHASAELTAGIARSAAALDLEQLGLWKAAEAGDEVAGDDVGWPCCRRSPRSVVGAPPRRSSFSAAASSAVQRANVRGVRGQLRDSARRSAGRGRWPPFNAPSFAAASTGPRPSPPAGARRRRPRAFQARRRRRF